MEDINIRDYCQFKRCKKESSLILFQVGICDDHIIKVFEYNGDELLAFLKKRIKCPEMLRVLKHDSTRPRLQL